MRKSFLTFPIVIIILFFTHFISSYKLLEQSKFFRIYDELAYLLRSYGLFLSLEKNPLNLLYNFFFVDRGDCHPGLFSSIGVLFWKLLQILKLFPDEISMILIPNLFFLIILMCAVYGMIEIIYKDKELALLGAFLISFVPIVYSVIRVYMLDFPLMSMAALSIFVLLKTDDFKSRVYSIVAGVIFSLSQLTKETSLIFVLPPLVRYLIYSLKENTENRKIILTNFSIFLVTFVSLSMMAYYPNLSACVARYKNIPYSLYGGTSSIYYYIFSFIWIYFQPILFFFLLIIFIISLKNNSLINKGVIFLIWLFFPLVVFSFFPNKDTRFLLPAIPPFLIISLGALVKKNIFRKILFFSLIAVCFFQWMVLTYSPGFLNYSPSLVKYRPYYLKDVLHSAIGVPSVLNKGQEVDEHRRFSCDLVDAIKLNFGGKEILFFLFPSQGIEYELWKIRLVKGVFGWFIFLPSPDPEIASKINIQHVLRNMSRAKYILNRDGDEGEVLRGLREKLIDELRKDSDESGLRLLNTFPLEGKTVYLYERQIDQ